MSKSDTDTDTDTNLDLDNSITNDINDSKGSDYSVILSV